MIWESKNDIPQRTLLGYLLSEKVGLWKETHCLLIVKELEYVRIWLLLLFYLFTCLLILMPLVEG